MSTESTDDLNSRLDGLQISTLYFRPTITISGVQKPYEEDEWRFVRIGQDAVLRFTKQCDRSSTVARQFTHVHFLILIC